MTYIGKKAFDKLGGERISKVADIQTEFPSLLAEKRKMYQTYRQTCRDITYPGIAKQNIDRILNIRPQENM